MTKLFILFAAISISCANTKVISTAEKQESAHEEATIQNNMIVGKFHKEDLQKEPFSSWFNSRYEKYTPNAEDLETIKKNINDYDIKVFMGTWCGDSKRETPKLLKLLDEADYNYDNLELIAVDYNKTTPEKLEEGLDIHHVPTIIFYKDGEEVNRFVEYSQGETFEQDIAKIVSGQEYKNSYAE